MWTHCWDGIGIFIWTTVNCMFSDSHSSYFITSRAYILLFIIHINEFHTSIDQDASHVCVDEITEALSSHCHLCGLINGALWNLKGLPLNGLAQLIESKCCVKLLPLISRMEFKRWAMDGVDIGSRGIFHVQYMYRQQLVVPNNHILCHHRIADSCSVSSLSCHHKIDSVSSL